MPELPEVETLAKHCAVFVDSCIVGVSGPSLGRSILGHTVCGVERVGKVLGLHLDNGHVIVFHFGMTGDLFISKGPKNVDSVRDNITFSNGLVLYRADARNFGKVTEMNAMPALGPDVHNTVLSKLPPCPNSTRAIKEALMDQNFIAGLGNIYTNETLFHAKVAPTRACCTITAHEWTTILVTAKMLLKAAIEWEECPWDRYLGMNAHHAEYKVYGKAGEPCPVCGHTIVRIEVAQRGTYYCPGCQR